ncbi:MAG TPA: hypothetical protein VLF21_01085 [Candidatus Saccharimonadales bacterium]|nr:hypothetical protein [Candidatus Saccharimonadales bacterium]
MNPRAFLTGLARAALAATVLFLSHYNFVWVAIGLICLPAIFLWWRGGRGRETALALAPAIVLGVSVSLLIGLNRPPLGTPILPPLTQIGLAVIYALTLGWLDRLRRAETVHVLGAVVLQALSLTAVYLWAAFWHLPDVAVVSVAWLASYITALWYLKGTGERAAGLLAATWALIVSQITWILAIWQVNYIISDGYIIVPQAVIIVLGLGYVFGSVHHAHATRALSRRRLIEYVAIAGVLLAIVVAGTHWNGSL